MKYARGFTLVELMIVMVVMTILMALAVINLRSTQPSARDSERATDAATIARGLEQRYNSGTRGPAGIQYGVLVSDGSCYPTSTKAALNGGSYPSTMEISYAQGNADSTNTFCKNQVSTSFLTEDLPGTDNKAFSAPNGGTLVNATATGVPSAATIGKNYIYQPLTATGSLCNTLEVTCTKFTLYYNTETGSNPATIGSLHQQ